VGAVVVVTVVWALSSLDAAVSGVSWPCETPHAVMKQAALSDSSSIEPIFISLIRNQTLRQQSLGISFLAGDCWQVFQETWGVSSTARFFHRASTAEMRASVEKRQAAFFTFEWTRSRKAFAHVSPFEVDTTTKTQVGIMQYTYGHCKLPELVPALNEAWCLRRKLAKHLLKRHFAHRRKQSQGVFENSKG
jgi:hypothetical protein